LTKVQVHFKLDNTLDEKLLERISDAQAIYGVERIALHPDMTALDVEYDATRFRPADLEAALRRCGLAIERIP
jgi:hypothetical protein